MPSATCLSMNLEFRMVHQGGRKGGKERSRRKGLAYGVNK